MAIELFNDFTITVDNEEALAHLIIESLWEDRESGWQPVAYFAVQLVNDISYEFPEARKYARKALKNDD